MGFFPKRVIREGNYEFEILVVESADQSLERLGICLGKRHGSIRRLAREVFRNDSGVFEEGFCVAFPTKNEATPTLAKL